MKGHYRARYKKINYTEIADMVLTVTKIKGEPQSLKMLVDDLSRHMSLGIDATKVYDHLGCKVVEKVEDLPNGVRRIVTLVLP